MFREFTSEGEDVEEQPPVTIPKRGALLNLEPKQLAKITQRIKDDIGTWETTSSSHRSDLMRWNDLLEGVTEETDLPWDGSCQFHWPLAAIHMKAAHSVACRSILSVEPLWFSKTIDPELQESKTDIEEFVNFQTRSALNIIGKVRQVIWTTARDGIGWLFVPYVEEYENYSDVEYYQSVEDFDKEFPTAEDAGISQEEYDKQRSEIMAEASPECPCAIRTSVKRKIYCGPKAEVVEEANFVRTPMTAETLRQCRLYGRLVNTTYDELEDRADQGFLWPEAIKKIRAMRKKSATQRNDWDNALDNIDGISQDDSKASDDLQCFEGFVRLNLDGKGRKKYFVTYSLTHEVVLGLSENEYRKEIFIRFRMIPRINRMTGQSFVGMLEDANLLLNHDIRREVNSDDIRNVPIFKGKMSSKINRDGTGFDPQADENQIRPGVFWWLENPQDVSVVNAQTGSNEDSRRRRQEIIQMTETLLGPSQMLSGRESSMDPNAPGNKTIALIAQSNMRMEDYLQEFRGGVENGDVDSGFDALGNLLVSHFYQFGDAEYTFVSEKYQKAFRTLERRAMRGDYLLATHGVTPTINSEIEFGKAVEWFGLMSKDPFFQEPVARWKLWNRLMMKGRFEGREDFLPSIEKVTGEENKARELEIEKKVISRLQSAGVIPPPPPRPMVPSMGGIPNIPPAQLQLPEMMQNNAVQAPGVM